MKVEIELSDLPITRECAYEYTGEYRKPINGEHFLDYDGAPKYAFRNYATPHPILRRIEPPEGYEMLLADESVSVGCQYLSEIGYWVSCGNKYQCEGYIYCRPKQPQPRYRPWTMDEVPRGAWLVNKHKPLEGAILTVDPDGVLVGEYHWAFSELLVDWTLDGELCGVRE